MDDVRVGMAIRELRRRAGLRQVDLARLAGVSQSLISAIECGRMGSVTMDTLRRVFGAAGAGFDGHVIWRGAALDRLLDARHASLVEASVVRLGRLGWNAQVEVTYSIYGERGSIDILAGREAARAVAVEEVKSDLVRLEETVRKLDEKERLVRDRIAFERFGWRPVAVARILVLPDTDRARGQVRRHASVLDLAFPSRGAAVRRWLRDPVGGLAGILFIADISRRGTNDTSASSRRVRRPAEPL